MATKSVYHPAVTSILSSKYEERLEYRRWVTPQPLARAPVHRWFVFPHSFSRELVWKLIDEWGLGPHDHILDPFVGAGTTLLAAKERGIAATGVDLSPLATFVSRVKLADYRPEEMQEAFKRIIGRFQKGLPDNSFGEGREFLQKCFSPEVLQVLCRVRAAILDESKERIRNFFLLGLLAILKQFSFAVRDGGWLRWRKRPVEAKEILPTYLRQISQMLEDLSYHHRTSSSSYQVYQGDARSLTLPGPYSAVITSPPYPNRHDYSRIFTVELLFHFLSETEIRELRYHSFSSHVEARQREYKNSPLLPPSFLRLMEILKHNRVDRRVPSMLQGYLEDLYATLISLRRLLQPKGKLAFIVGNVRYLGEMIEVDNLLAHLAPQAGFKWLATWVVRYRGNSAQQMGRHGRKPARESVVILQRSA